MSMQQTKLEVLHYIEPLKKVNRKETDFLKLRLTNHFIYADHVKIAEKLIANNININQVDEYGCTALHRTGEHGNFSKCF